MLHTGSCSVNLNFNFSKFGMPENSESDQAFENPMARVEIPHCCSHGEIKSPHILVHQDSYGRVCIDVATLTNKQDQSIHVHVQVMYWVLATTRYPGAVRQEILAAPLD